MGPLGMAFLDPDYAPVAIIILVIFWFALMATWPSAAPVFVPGAFILSSRRAAFWCSKGRHRYRLLFGSRPASFLNGLPYFLPLCMDLILLVLLIGCLKQAWFNVERGSWVAASLTAFLSTPVILVSVGFLGFHLVSKAIRPFRLDRASDYFKKELPT